MSFEQMQSTMQFIVELRAQHAVLMQKYEERVGELEAAFATLTELARKADERGHSTAERMDSLPELLKTESDGLDAYLPAQSEGSHARLAARKEAFDARLAASREKFERSPERRKIIDQTLALLTDLAQRNARRRNKEL